MAPLPVIPDVVRVAFTWTNPAYTRHAVNVMHFNCVPTDIAHLRTTLEANVNALMWSQTPAASTITSLRFTPLDGMGSSLDFATSGGSKWAGNAGTGDTTPQVAAIVKLLTGIRGRSHRGRVFLPWVAEGNNTNGTFTSAAVVSAMQGAWTTFIAAMSTAAHDLQVTSYHLATSTDVQTCVVESQLATQRRRQPR